MAHEIDLTGMSHEQARGIVFERFYSDSTEADYPCYRWGSAERCGHFWLRVLSEIPVWRRRYVPKLIDRVFFWEVACGSLRDVVMDGMLLVGEGKGIFVDSVPQPLRVEIAMCLQRLFVDLYEAECTANAAPILVDDPEHHPLDGSCTMFWDLLGVASSCNDAEIEEILFRTTCDTLWSSNETCQSSGLHGLGHEIRRGTPHADRSIEEIARWLAVNDPDSPDSGLQGDNYGRQRTALSRAREVRAAARVSSSNIVPPRPVSAMLVDYARDAFIGAIA